VGGQFWSITGEFPTETEQLLTITFYDKNGAVELARYSQEYRVGSNVSETVRIPADQFDANQFDSDGGGVNNLVELNVGTDPFVDEDSQLEVIDSFALNNAGGQYSRISVSQTIESLVLHDRPYIDSYETDCCVVFENGYSVKTLFGIFRINTDSETRQSNYESPDLSTTTVVTTVSKEIDDPYWRVVTVKSDSDTTEYFARDLHILHDRDDEESDYFTCDFVDF